MDDFPKLTEFLKGSTCKIDDHFVLCACHEKENEMYIFPMQETQDAIEDHIKDPDDIRKFLCLYDKVTLLKKNMDKELIEMYKTKTKRGTA